MMRLGVLAFVVATAAVQTAHARTWQKQEVTLTTESESPEPATPPTVKLLSPEWYGIVDTKCAMVELPRKSKYDVSERVLRCTPAKPADIVIKLQVTNWKMSKGGQGVALVIDNNRALVVYDNKPVKLTDIAPELLNASHAKWHMLAAFAVKADGLAVRAPSALAVTEFSVGEPDRSVDIEQFKDNAVEVVNLPLLGKFGMREEESTWRLASDVARVQVLAWLPPTARYDVSKLVVSVLVQGPGISEQNKGTSGDLVLTGPLMGVHRVTGFLSEQKGDPTQFMAQVDLMYEHAPVPPNWWNSQGYRWLVK